MARVKKVSIKKHVMSPKLQLITAGRVLNQGIRNLFRNLWLATAATAIMVVTLTVVSMGVFLTLSLNETVSDITDEVSLEVFLQDGASEKTITVLKTELNADPNVKTVTYVSKEEALEKYKLENADKPELLSALDLLKRGLPASLKVELNDLTLVQSSIDVVESSKYDEVVDEINFDEQRKDSINRIASWQDFIATASLLSGAIFAFISILIIFNTIRMAIYTRSYEIEIMKLIGATPGYIRGPFLIEASLYGIIAGLITLGILFSVVLTVFPQLGDFLEFSDASDLFKEYWYIVSALVLGLGFLIGYISAIIAMNKYLRLKRW